MLQKVIVVLVGLVMTLVGGLAPEGLFASKSTDALKAATGTGEQTLATVRAADGLAFAKVSILWAEVDGRRVTEDAWGTGEVKELRFKVGVKDVEGVKLALGDKLVPLKPTDVLTIRLFRGDFSYRDMGTAAATLQLQGTVQTTLLNEGGPTGKLRTETTGAPTSSPQKGGVARLAYVVLSTGQSVDTVAVQSGGERFFTQESETAGAPASKAGNLLAKWVKIDGKPIREYTWGDAAVGLIEFEPADASTGSVGLSYNGEIAQAASGSRVIVKDFVGEYLVYQVPGGLVRLRLDGYAADFTTGSNVGVPVLSGPGAPMPAFDIVPENPRTTDVITLRDRSTDDGVIVFWRWDFGDGVASALQDPTHRFTRPGAYNVTLTVTDDDLHTSEVSRVVVVRNTDPVADFEWLPRVVTTDSIVAFTDLSLDADGTIANWTWDFGDGKRAYTKSPTHQFRKSGTFTVTLSVLDDLGGRSTVTKNILVRNHPPVASFEWAPLNPTTNVPVTFTSLSTDRDGTIVGWSWDFDGKPGADAEGAVVAHTFRTPGRHVVTLTVTDDLGAVDKAYVELNLLNTPPRAWFTYGPDQITAETEVIFNNEATDTDGWVVLSEWTWGDGSSTRLITPDPERDTRELERNVEYDVSFPTPPQARHRFPAAGSYDVKLCVTDNRGGTDCVTRSVQVNQSAPRGDLVISPLFPIYRNQTITFDSTRSRDPDGDPIVFREIAFGDGVVATNQAITTHMYTQLGPKEVKLTLKDSHDLVGTTTRTILVQNALPTGRIVASMNPILGGHPVTFSVADLNDPDGPSAAITYQWTFSQGGQPSTQATVTRTFPPEVGTLVVSLVLTDGEGGRSQEIRQNFAIEVARPIPSFTLSDETPTKDQAIVFTDTSTSANGPITQRQWLVDQSPVSTAPSFEWTFTDGNVHTVTLEVGDDVAPGREVVSRTIDVNLAPKAVANLLTGGSLRPDQEIRFRDGSSDPDGQADIVRRFWDFGDGNTLETSETQVSHTYTAPGSRVVTLTVEDAAGASSTATLTLNIQGQRPIAAWHIASPSPPFLRGQTLQFVSDSTHPDGTPITGYRWDFGDGTVLEGTPTPTHTYATSGLYYVKLEVSDGVFKSVMGPGAGKYVYVGSDQPLQVSIRALLPHGGLVDFSSPHIEVTLAHGKITGGKAEYTKSDFVPGMGEVSLTLLEGTWGQGDSLVASVIDTRYMDRPLVQSVQLREGSAVLPLTFRLPLPLEVTARAVSEYEPEIFRRHLVTGEKPVVYDLGSDFHGDGTVVYADGVPAKRANVTVQLRYVPAVLPVGGTSVRDLLGQTSFVNNNDLIGWCTAAEVRADDLGAFTWSVDQGSDCVLSRGDVHGVGRWQVRAIARDSFAPVASSQPADFYVDPIGLFATSYLP